LVASLSGRVGNGSALFLFPCTSPKKNLSRRINVLEGFYLMKPGEPDSKFSPEIEEIDK
jgi:hypothetical protein